MRRLVAASASLALATPPPEVEPLEGVVAGGSETSQAKLTKPLSGFTVVSAHASWRRGPVELWLRVNNLFDAEYETFGIYGDADELGFADPRFLSPGAPRSLLAGVRLKL